MKNSSQQIQNDITNAIAPPLLNKERGQGGEVKKAIFVFILLILFSSQSFAQSNLVTDELQTNNVIVPAIIGMLILPNPMLQYEDNTVYFGLTKQVSFILYAERGFGISRVGFEYSYLFAKEEKNNFRGLYIHSFPISTGDFAATILEVETGYYTDTKVNGFSTGAGIGIILGASEPFVINPYLRARHTFIKDAPDNTDLTLGVGIGFHFF